MHVARLTGAPASGAPVSPPVHDSWQFRDRRGRRFPAHHIARPRKGMSRWEWVYEPGPEPAFTWGRHEEWS